MISLIGFALVALFGAIFVLVAITPMIAETRTDLVARQAEIVSLDPQIVHNQGANDQADAA